MSYLIFEKRNIEALPILCVTNELFGWWESAKSVDDSDFGNFV